MRRTEIIVIRSVSERKVLAFKSLISILFDYELGTPYDPAMKPEIMARRDQLERAERGGQTESLE